MKKLIWLYTCIVLVIIYGITITVISYNLNKHLESTENGLTNTKNELSDANDKMDDMETNRTFHNYDVDELRSTIDDLETEISDLKDNTND